VSCSGVVVVGVMGVVGVMWVVFYFELVGCVVCVVAVGCCVDIGVEMVIVVMVVFGKVED